MSVCYSPVSQSRFPGLTRSVRVQRTDHLAALGITADYVETGCPHDMNCMLAAQGMNSAAFIAARLVPSLPGDLNGDGDVDLADFAQFEICFTGPGGTLVPGCEPGDFDLDNDADCDDWAQFGLVWTGPGQPPQLT